ncbi:hypothetical protein LXA43DRAFT_359487 [Ganoderma leucocontextum]|nr:hypothetical protein LXA43DRAFT_359487 [Ganoderma leucocontextum]
MVRRSPSSRPPSQPRRMSVPLSPTPENVSRPIYVLPSTQHIRVTPRKRDREDENESVSVAASAKRIKPLDAAGGGCKSTPRAVKDAGRPNVLDTKDPPSIHNASEYLDAYFGYGTQTEKHYEYGSDTDEEDPASDTDEPMLSADEDAVPTANDGMTDISEEAFRAEIDQLFVGSDDLVKTFFHVDSDSDGEDSDDESELDVADADDQGRVIEWAKPGPSPLRRALDLSPERPRKLTLIRQKARRPRVIPIVRTSRPTQGKNREAVWRDALERCHFRSMSLPSTDSDVIRRSNKAEGKRRADDNSPNYYYFFDSAASKEEQKRGMGGGTPAGARFGRWTPLTLPASPYAYWTHDDTIPFGRFGQAAFHGADAWGSLSRPLRRSTQAADTLTQEGYEGPVRHILLVGVGPTRRQVEVRTDMRAMRHLRAHGIELASMPGRLAGKDLKGVTTGMILEEAARMQALWAEAERAGAPSPEQQLVDEDMPTDEEMLVFDEEDVEELGPWLPWTPTFDGFQ